MAEKKKPEKPPVGRFVVREPLTGANARQLVPGGIIRGPDDLFAPEGWDNLVKTGAVEEVK